jgi:hypothetical protein
LSAWGLRQVRGYTWEGVGARIVAFYQEAMRAKGAVAPEAEGR